MTFATGIIDAVSFFHLNVFTAYMTGTVVLLGGQLATGLSHESIKGAVALIAFILGGIIGGRLVRKQFSKQHFLTCTLPWVAALIIIAAVIGVVSDHEFTKYFVILFLGLATGLQNSASRHTNVPDMMVPAATMIIHGLAHDSSLAGGKKERQGRRLMAVLCIAAGAAAGAAISAWSICAALVTAAALILLAAVLSYRLLK